MYIVGTGNADKSPIEPVERAEYMLEQMKIYLSLARNKDSEEYRQVNYIFNAFLNVMTIKEYVILRKELITTSKHINGLCQKGLLYWNEYLKFVHWRLTGNTF